jgi:hypothetical protein
VINSYLSIFIDARRLGRRELKNEEGMSVKNREEDYIVLVGKYIDRVKFKLPFAAII